MRTCGLRERCPLWAGPAVHKLTPSVPRPAIMGTRKCTMKFTRITTEADKMGGVPCIRGLRVPVATVVAMVADAMTNQEILEAYPYLEAEDIKEALRYAAQALQERAIPLTTG